MLIYHIALLQCTLFVIRDQHYFVYDFEKYQIKLQCQVFTKDVIEIIQKNIIRTDD